MYSEVNKARLGCFKDEAAGEEIEEFICLSPKSYSYKMVNQKRDCRLKGVKQYKKKVITHDDYRDAYEQWSIKRVNQRNIQSTHHQLRTVNMNKVALSAFEDKRYWLSANYSVPYGHYKCTDDYITISHASDLQPYGGDESERSSPITHSTNSNAQ